MATVTQLQFNISSNYDGGAVDRARQSIAALNRDLDALSNKSVKVTVEVDNSALTRLRTELDQFSRMHVHATASVNADSGGLGLLTARLDHFGAQRYVAHADVNVDHAHTGFSTLVTDASRVTSGFGGLASAAGGAGSALGGAGNAAGGAGGGINAAGQSASSSTGAMSALGTGVLYASAALAAMGPIAALASAAVIGTLGVGFIGLGALILSKTKEIGETMKKFKTGLEQDMAQAASAMKTQLLGGINELMVGLHKLTPAFTQAFAASGKLIDPLVKSLLGFVHNVMPGVITALRAAGPVFEGLRVGMSALGTGLSKMFAGMAQGAKGAGQALAVTLGGIGKILGIVGQAFGQMAAAGAKALSGLMTGLVSLVSGAMQGFVIGVKLMSATLGPFLAALGKLAGTILQALLPVLAQLLSALMAGLTPVLKALTPLFAVVGGALLKIAQAITPLLLIIGQLVAKLITALMPAFTAFLNVAVKVVQVVLAAFTPAIAALVPPLVKIATTIAAAMMPALNKLAQLFVQISPQITIIVNLFVQLIIRCLTPLIPLLPQIVAMWIRMSTVLLPLAPIFLKLITLLLQLALTVLPPLAGALATVIGWLVKVAGAFGTALKAIVDFVTQTVPKIAGWVSTTAQAFAGWVTKTATGFANWVTTVAQAFAGWVTKTAASIAGWVVDVVGKFAGWSANVAGIVTRWVADFVGKILGWSANVAGAIGRWVADAVKKFADWSANVAGIVTRWVADFVKKVLDWSANTAGALSRWIADQLKKFADWAAKVLSIFGKWVVDSIKKFGEFLSWVGGKFFDALKNLFLKLIPNMLTQAANVAGKAWSLIKKLMRDPIDAVINVVYNNGIVKLWNIVAGVFGAPKLTAFHLPAFATGGPVNGPGNGTSDSVVARLSSGEHVWTAAEVDAAGGHDAMLAMRESVMGSSYKAAVHGDGMGGFALGGIPNPISVAESAIGAIGGAIGKLIKDVGGVAGAAFDIATGFGGDIIKELGKLALGEIAGPMNSLIQKAANVGKGIVKGIIPGTPFLEDLIVGGKSGVVSTGGGNPQDVPGNAQGGVKSNGGGMIQMMADAIKNWITSHDVPVGGGNTAEAQAWADKQVGKPYSLGAFGSAFDCSSFMSGIAQIILGKSPSPLFTTFAFTGAKQGPATFEKDLNAPFMVGVENRGIGHMAGTLNGKNYEATPPAVRSGPGARGAKDPMFDMVYGMKSSVGGGQGVIPAGQHKAIIDAALAAAHVPPPGTMAQWEAGLNTLITRESAWNSSAINKTDSNAAAGHPSQGLAQVIPSTFAAYHVAGTSNNILDPIANVAAAINYIVHRYGNITSVQQANASLPPKGYWTGTNSARSGWHMVGERGPEWTWFHGGEKVLPHGQRPGGGDGAVVVTVENHWHGNPTKEAVQHAETGMAERLRRACHAGVGKRPN